MTPREDDDDDRVDDAIAVRDRALARRGAFLREPALVVRPPRTRGDFLRGVDARSRGGWGPLLARPREIRAGTFVSARPSRPSSRGTPCPRGTRTRRSRSRGSRTTPRRGTTARYARARPRSRRRTPPLARRSRGTHTRHSLVLFSSSRVGVCRTPSAASGSRRYFSRTHDAGRDLHLRPARRPSSARLFVSFDEKNVYVCFPLTRSRPHHPRTRTYAYTHT